MSTEKRLLNYTQMPKLIPHFIKNKNTFIYPFDRAISRTKYKADHFNFKLESETVLDIITYSNTNLSWDECCEKRAVEILNLKKERYFISYSGGIDSTGLMVAILQNWPSIDLGKICLVLTSHSIIENPIFFSKYLIRFPWVNFHDGINFIASDDSSILITGVNGDQLFGSDIYFPACRKFGEEILRKNYKDHVISIYELWNRENSKKSLSGNFLFEHYHPIVEECPFEIKTVFDYFWWVNFTQKWQHVKFKYLEGKNQCLDLRYGQKVLHFFDTLYFQKWSMENHDLKIKSDLYSYKWIAKEYINKFVKDFSQLNLTKQYSVQKTYNFTENRLAISENWEEILDELELEKYAR